MRKSKLVIGIDADDTLWHNEDLFDEIQSRFKKLLYKYLNAKHLGSDKGSVYIDKSLVETERNNLHLTGYGIKAFTLSMLETAIRITDKKITAQDINQILEWGKEMLATKIELIDNVEDVIKEISPIYRLGLITKGELFIQETRIETSGLDKYFDFIEILSNKSSKSYKKSVLKPHNIDIENFIMVGNSLFSDVLPVLELGGRAIHISYELTWELEEVPHDKLKAAQQTGRLIELETIKELPKALAELAS